MKNKTTERRMKECIFVAAVAVVAFSTLAREETTEPKVGEPAPGLTLEKLLQAPQDRPTSWYSLKGKVVVLEFWATWCAPCIAAIPHFNDLADQFKDQPVQFIAVTDENESVAAQFLKRRPIHAWIGLNTNRSMFKAYGITGIPHTFVVDKKGRIVASTYPSELTESVLKAVLAGKKVSLAQAQNASVSLRPGDLRGGAKSGDESLFQVVIRPSQEQNDRSSSGGGALTILGSTLLNSFSSAYGISPVRIITNSALPEERFDFVVKTPSKQSDVARNWLRQSIEATFDLACRRETRDLDVLVLTATGVKTEHLTPTVSTSGSSSSAGPGRIHAINVPLSSLAWALEGKLKQPVVDETGLTNHYDLELLWDSNDEEPPAQALLARIIREQLGLQLTPARRSIEVLVVDTSRKSKQ